MYYSDKEKLIILSFYKDCKDPNLKLVLKKLLIETGILQVKISKPGDSPVKYSKEKYDEQTQ